MPDISNDQSLRTSARAKLPSSGARSGSDGIAESVMLRDDGHLGVVEREAAGDRRPRRGLHHEAFDIRPADGDRDGGELSLVRRLAPAAVSLDDVLSGSHVAELEPIRQAGCSAPTGVVASAPERRLELRSSPPVIGSPLASSATPETVDVAIRETAKFRPSTSCDAVTETSRDSGGFGVPG